MKVAVVGGGSAGWLTATMLDAMLNGRARPKRVDITLIESPRIPRIGVGESTVPTLLNTLRLLGISERDFLREADATFKQGIKFAGWRSDPSHSYYHTFDRYPPGHIDMLGLSWAASQRNIPFAYYVSAQPSLCDMDKAPKRLGDPDYAGAMAYAFHMDAEKFAGYLAKVGRERGIEHVQDDVVDVALSGEGRIDSITLAAGASLAADWFIDCTGFARVLTSRLPGFAYHDFADWLICDRAVAMQVPREDGSTDPIRPYTTATALDAGWAWDIGLRNRRGTGYVYSSQHISDDEAEATLRAREMPASANLQTRLLRFRAGRLDKAWIGNCISIGLSGGFVEPMESTGIYLVEYAARTFAELFPLFGRNDLLADRFNRLMADRYDELIDFINVHYVLSDRRDTPFWRDATAPSRMTERVRERVALWQDKMISASDFANSHQLFGYQNYEFCVYGLDAPSRTLARGTQAIAPIPAVQRTYEKLKDALPDHRHYIAEIDRGM
ncbi:MAG: tryptophan halogenase family protein [Novosphingobium sp.]